MDGGPESGAMLKRCSVCLGVCHEAEAKTLQDSWCGPECRHTCLNRVCGGACSVSEVNFDPQSYIIHHTPKIMNHES